MNKLIHVMEGVPKRIAVLRALQLGDMMCAVPAFRALRAAFPDAVITLVGLPWARGFVRRFNFYLDDFIEFPGYPGLPERTPQIDRIPEFLREMQWLEFDLALQMQGSGEISNPLVEMFGARCSAGYYLPGHMQPNEELFMPYPEHEHEVWRHLRLMEFLGLPLQGDALEFPLYPQDWEALQAIGEQYGLQAGSYACLHVGARAENRRWPVERFAAVGDGLARRGLQVVLTGTEAEAPLARAVEVRMKAAAINLTGQTRLGALAALLSNARLLVCNDTGVSHLAAALLTPSVVLFSASEPHRWAPKNLNLNRIIPWAGNAGPEAVLVEVDNLLHKEPSYAA